MTIEQIEAAILADKYLKALAIAGRDGDIARAMTTASTATPITIGGLLGGLSPESAAKLAVNPNARDVRDRVLAGDLAGLSLWVSLFTAGGVITENEAATITAAIQAGVPNAVTVTVDEVNKALKPHRPDGKVGQQNWRD